MAARRRLLIDRSGALLFSSLFAAAFAETATPTRHPPQTIRSYTAPCDPQHPVKVQVTQGAKIKCTFAISSDPINDPGRAYVYCVSSCGGPWTLYPNTSDEGQTTKAGQLVILGNGKGPNCSATVSVTE
jgi:hypothetical protein